MNYKELPPATEAHRLEGLIGTLVYPRVIPRKDGLDRYCYPAERAKEAELDRYISDVFTQVLGKVAAAGGIVDHRIGNANIRACTDYLAHQEAVEEQLPVLVIAATHEDYGNTITDGRGGKRRELRIAEFTYKPEDQEFTRINAGLVIKKGMLESAVNDEEGNMPYHDLNKSIFAQPLDTLIRFI